MPEFSSKNEGQWFSYDPENEKLGGVCLRELSTEEHARIDKIVIKHKKRIMRGVLVDDTTTNEKLESKLRWDYCIVDWSKTSLDGQQLECTSENKVKMMKVTDFVKFVADSLGEKVDENKTLDEARLKNSESSSNGNSKNPTAKTV